MAAEYRNCNVIASCPDCDGAITTFELGQGGKEFGHIIISHGHGYNGEQYNRIIYQLLRCAGCGRGGLAKIHANDNVHEGCLEWFIPSNVISAKLPEGIPEGVEKEFREAEKCASNEIWRGASGLFRSTLEKLLRANGYLKGSLKDRIDQASEDGVITEARKTRAHEDVRVLGNDVLHEDWKEITEEEVTLSHKYVQRIIEDLYDDRESVMKILIEKGRIKDEKRATS